MHAVRLHLDKKHVGKREPALINLPLPLPSIPVLSPILTPILDGNQNQNKPTSNTQATVKPTTPTAQPPESTPTSTPGGGTDNGGNGGNGDNGGNGGGNNGGNSGGGNNGGGNGDVSSSNSLPDPTGNNGSGDNQGPSHTRAVNAGARPTGASDDDFFAAPSGGSNSRSSRITTVYSGTVPIATQTVAGGSDGGLNGPEGGNTGDGGGDGTSNSGSSNSPKVSPGVIAAVSIIVALILLILFVIVRRKRYIAKRAERRSLWWKEAKRDSGWSGPTSLEATAGTRSARSSFATTFDHAMGAEFSARAETPPLPAMAEIRDAHTTGLLLHSQPQSPIQVPITPALISFDDVNDRRNSTFSTRSGDSDNQSQYLTADPHMGIPTTNASPMSVRPFSPSESFAFPKPPPSATAAATPGMNEAPRDPFSDQMKATDSWTPLFFGTEVIRRPFSPTLHDEIPVSAGEVVRVSKVFDDGWALVEKFPIQDESDKGKKKALQGLIPVDCLREAGQELTNFIVSTRVSSYSAIPETNMGAAV